MATTRIPVALLSAMFVAAVSLGTMVVIINLYPEVGGLQVLTHCAAGLCLGWVAIGFVLEYRRPDLAGRMIGSDIQDVLRMAAIVLGLIAVIIVTYVAATEALRRTPYLFDYRAQWQINVWRTGLFDLALLATAVLLAWARIRDNQLLTVCFWILVLAGLWMSLQLPASRWVPIDTGGSYPEMTRWGLPFMIWSAVVVAGFSVIESVGLHHRRANAWPDALDRLTSPPPAWPGFHYSVGIIGVLILILACVHIVTIWATASAFIAGVAILAMVGRRWEENLADLGVGLISLGIASLPLMWVATPEHLTPPWFANVFARLTAGLAVTVTFWHWLAGVWDQQLDNGQAWTPAGRLIRNMKRVGFLCGATGVLVAMQLAFWPRFPRVQELDNSIDRWIWGAGAHLLLIAALTWSGLRARKSTLAWLAVFGVASLVAFTLIRLGDQWVAQLWSRYWPLAMAVLAGLALPPAAAAYRSGRWRPFGEPLLIFGVLIGPASALAGVTFGPLQTMPTWVPAATFALLAGVYLLATAKPGPKVYLVPSITCAAMAVWRLIQMR